MRIAHGAWSAPRAAVDAGLDAAHGVVHLGSQAGHDVGRLDERRMPKRREARESNGVPDAPPVLFFAICKDGAGGVRHIRLNHAPV